MDLDILDVTIFDGRTIRPENRVSIRDGIITEIATGPAQVPADRTITATGRLLTPGFVDAHVHTTFGGQESLSCDLSSADGLAETLDLIRGHLAATHADSAPAHDWVIGGGWAMADFPGGAPTADILDAVCPDRPALLLSADHHSAWVNTAALTVAGIDAATESPAGGIIVADDYGTPTGCLHESAIDLVSAHVPEATDAEVHAGLLAGQNYLNSLGVTAWMDAIVGDYGGHRDPYDTYVHAASSEELHSEVVGSLWWPREVRDIDAEVAELTARARSEGRFRATSVKFMLDGIVESRTAAMNTEYTCTLRRVRHELLHPRAPRSLIRRPRRGRFRHPLPRDRRCRGQSGPRRLRGDRLAPCRGPPPHRPCPGRRSRRRPALRAAGDHREPAGAVGLL